VTAELACIELVELATDLLEGELSDEDRARVSRHLAGCDGCTTYVEQLRRTIAAAARLAPDAVGTQVLERLQSAHRSLRPPRSDA
jgi:anti-sigma factor RsiW